jgi:hypothetical protein
VSDGSGGSGGTRVSLAAARAVADAVLYEGYALYPYRASALKNRLRWQFGVLAPRAFSEADGGERWWLEAQCLLELAPGAKLDGELRFLHVERRLVEQRTTGGDGFRAVPSLDVGDRLHVPWDEGEVRTIALSYDLAPETPPAEAVVAFAVPAALTHELVSAPVRPDEPSGEIRGRVIRQRWTLAGTVRMSVEPVPASRPLHKLRVRVENITPAGLPTPATRDEILPVCCVGAHLLLAVSKGAFVSLRDPPPWARGAAADCASVGTYPVLAGPPGRRDLVLSAPIILDEHPRIAPESPGDLFDATEIDEILTLRTLTLTDDEKREARATSPRTAAVIDRVESMTPETLALMHGAVRDPAPAPRALAPGDRVRLRPGTRRADAQDLFLIGRTATVQAVLEDVDGRGTVAVSLDDDPATELLRWHGRYLYFQLDEIEPLAAAGGDTT